MTSKEKLQLFQEKGGYWFKMKWDLTGDIVSMEKDSSESHWNRFMANTCSVYFYDNYNEMHGVGVPFYSRYDINDLDSIYKFLENVVLITKARDAEPLWIEPIVQCGNTTYHAIRGRYYSERYLQSLIQANQLNTEMATGVFKIKDKQYTKSELEKIVALAEQFSSLTK